VKILVLHNEYQHRGGEDVVVENEVELLRSSGFEVRVHIVSNKKVNALASKLFAAIGSVFSIRSFRLVKDLIRSWQPDVVHVHNFFPLLSPSVFYACRSAGVAVIFTLHNYRIVCPTALLMHDGRVTERSIRSGPWWSLTHRVYRRSLVGTFMLCFLIWIHKRLRTWHRTVDRFIVLTEFARQRFVSAGLPAQALVVKPNFVAAASAVGAARAGFLFVGRLSAEKGVDVLLDAAGQLRRVSGDRRVEVAVAGTGPLDEKVSKGCVEHLGALSAGAVRERMQSAAALVIPSNWYEGFPMVLVEAYASGLPVIASRIGALAELVEDGVTGLLFEPGNPGDLAAKMTWALNNADEMLRMGEAARRRYELLYAPQQNVSQLVSIYRAAISARERRSDKND
jgi:glycosyltransferase involved in cell wall biosynthesis